MLGDQDGLFTTESLVASRPLSQTSKISYNSTSKQNWRWISDTVIISTGWNNTSSNYTVSSFNINDTSLQLVHTHSIDNTLRGELWTESTDYPQMKVHVYSKHVVICYQSIQQGNNIFGIDCWLYFYDNNGFRFITFV